MSGSARRPPDEGRLLQLVYYAYVAFSRVALAVPEAWAYRLAGVLGGLAARRNKRREQVARNLARVTGEPADSDEIDALVVAAYRSYARYWLETFRLVREGREFFLERFQATGDDNLDRVLARGKGAVVVVGHLGNWDAAGAWVGARGNLLVTVAEMLRPRRMFDFFADHRASLGMRIHAAQAGVTRTLIEEVRNGAVVAIVGDRDLKGTGIEVDFFGEPATLPGGAASIALKAGVPLMVAGVYGEVLSDGRRGWSADISAPIELPDDRGPEAVAKLTQQVGERLEEYIARRPEEWHVFQPFWIADRKRAATKS
ncbi:MAG: phosphatidylinositol mannoside acyltransferase [Actinomycetota bacterium]